MYWLIRDIQDYLGCGRNKASYIRYIAITKYNGQCGWDKRKVKKESIMKAIRYLDRED